MDEEKLLALMMRCIFKMCGDDATGCTDYVYAYHVLYNKIVETNNNAWKEELEKKIAEKKEESNVTGGCREDSTD